MFLISPLLVALQFLTILPVRIKVLPDPKTIGHSLLYYPLVGLIIGLLLSAIGWIGSGVISSLHAAIVLATWVTLTGALHLDGLADSADAWLGGLGDRKRTLAIMKDPCCGPSAVVTLVVVLLIKFAALEQLIRDENWVTMIMIPVVARTSLILLFLTTPYVRENGLGSLASRNLPRRAGLITILLSVALVVIIMGKSALWLVLTVAGVFYLLRRLMLRRIGGTTGDTAGALVEITETAMLVSVALTL